MSHQLARDDKDKGTMHPTKLLSVQTIALQWHTAAKEVWQCKQLKWEHKVVTHSHSGNLCPSGPQGYRCPHKLCSHTQPQWQSSSFRSSRLLMSTQTAVTHSHNGNLHPSGPQSYRCPHKLCSHTQPQWQSSSFRSSRLLMSTQTAVTHSHNGNPSPSGSQGYRCPHKLCSHTQPQWQSSSFRSSGL